MTWPTSSRSSPSLLLPGSLTAVHPLWLRISHWLNALAVLVLVTSGWQIYNASPLFEGLVFVPWLTLGEDLTAALRWHFAAMWLLAGNGAVYLASNLVGGRFAARFLPLTARALMRDVAAALRGRLGHADVRHYNQVQRLAYLLAMLDTLLLVLSGLVLWKSVQFPLLRELLGGYEMARRVHFVAMAGLVAFVALHLLMVALVPRTLPAMLGKGRGA